MAYERSSRQMPLYVQLPGDYCLNVCGFGSIVILIDLLKQRNNNGLETNIDHIQSIREGSIMGRQDYNGTMSL